MICNIINLESTFPQLNYLRVNIFYKVINFNNYKLNKKMNNFYVTNYFINKILLLKSFVKEKPVSN